MSALLIGLSRRQRITLNIIEWASTFTSFAGAALISSNISISGYAYIIFMVSSICGCYVGFVLRRWGIFTMNMGFNVINAWGIWRWLIMPIM